MCFPLILGQLRIKQVSRLQLQELRCTHQMRDDGPWSNVTGYPLANQHNYNLISFMYIHVNVCVYDSEPLFMSTVENQPVMGLVYVKSYRKPLIIDWFLTLVGAVQVRRASPSWSSMWNPIAETSWGIWSNSECRTRPMWCKQVNFDGQLTGALLNFFVLKYDWHCLNMGWWPPYDSHVGYFVV